jgi:NADH-quinone oxidoreductase subunit L
MFMTLASLSLMGAPVIFSGFWSKDMILEGALIAGQLSLFILGLITAAITSFYSLRMIGITFLGEKSEHLTKLEHHGHHVHDPSLTMLLPFAILTGATIALGVVGFFAKDWLEHLFHGYLGEMLHSSHVVTTEVSKESAELLTIVASVAMLLLGSMPSYLLYIKKSKDPTKIIGRNSTLKAIQTLIFNRYYLNRTYYTLVVNPIITGSSWLLKNFETGMIDRFNYVLAGVVNTGSSWLLKSLELGIIDKFNYVLASVISKFSNAFRRTHTGVLTYNVVGIVLGTAIILLLFMWIIVKSGGVIL